LRPWHWGGEEQSCFRSISKVESKCLVTYL
jgi:hypothetical protein